MTRLHLTRRSSARPALVWKVLADFGGYGAWMPLTRMRCDPGEPRVGWGFAGLSGVGPLRFADEMRLTVWEPLQDSGHLCTDRTEEAEGSDDSVPGRFRVAKTGRVLEGWIDVTVLPDAPGTVVRWSGEVRLRPLPSRLVDPILRPVITALYARALDAMLGEASRRQGAAP